MRVSMLRLLAVEIAQTVIDHTQASQGTEPATNASRIQRLEPDQGLNRFRKLLKKFMILQIVLGVGSCH